MTTAKIIDGKAVAAQIREEIANRVAALKRERPVPPGLAVILVGEDPASQVYVRSKERQAQEAGFKSVAYRRPADISEEQLITLIEGLNEDPTIDGILVQLPLPAHIDEAVVINAISPAKDVDGFHPINVGRLMTGEPSLLPCTPFGCITLLKRTLGDFSGLDAVVVGRSNIVGKPMAALLLRENCTVTVAHSRTRDLAAVCRRADILVAAVGKPGFVQGEWIKPGATVIDVGINRVATADGGSRLVGDVDFAAAAEVAGAITPVPGGVGPMTIAMLLRNTLESYCRANRLACALD